MRASDYFGVAGASSLLVGMMLLLVYEGVCDNDQAQDIILFRIPVREVVSYTPSSVAPDQVMLQPQASCPRRFPLGGPVFLRQAMVKRLPAVHKIHAAVRVYLAVHEVLLHIDEEAQHVL